MIRFATKEDAPAIAPLILLIIKDMGLAILNMIPEDKLLTILTEAIMDPNYRFGFQRGLVYEHQGKVVGAAFGYSAEEEVIIDKPLVQILKKYGYSSDLRLFIDKESFPNEWYLDSIAVDENYRGLGIGSKLLDALPMKAQQANKKIIGLNVDKANVKAKKLYLRKGFKEVSQVILSGHIYDHMQMRIIN